MAFPPGFLEELKARISLPELVGRRVRLTRKGREHSGLCPFHNEKTPSFTVSEGKGFFHCFGCGAHGNAFDFVMRTENLSFPETVEKLAAEAGMAVPQMSDQDRRRAERAKGLAEAMEAAALYFTAQLGTAAGGKARDYVERRGLSAETVARFRLGYAPAGRTALKEALLARGFPEPVLVEAGLLIAPEGGGATYDRFRDRLMFPIGDRRGRIIAFGGRILGDGQPKYLNSPETPLFHKGRNLYNLSLAREAAGAAGEVVVAEGYMDVIALAQAGIANAVAPLGTALTEEQMQELWRLAPMPVLCFDGDRAGQGAALRAADRALPLIGADRSFRFAILPAGLDPDDLVRQQGPDAMRKVLAGASPLVDLLWRRETEGRALDTPERLAGLKASLDELCQRIAHEEVRNLYRREFEGRRQRLLDEINPRRTFAKGGGRGTGGGRPGPNRPAPAPDRLRRQRLLLAVALNHPELLDRGADELAALDLADPNLDNLRQAILEAHASADRLDAEGLQRQLTDRGLAEQVASVANSELLAMNRFARPGASLQEAEAGWRDTLALLGRAAFRAHVDEARAALVRTESEAEWRRLHALKRRETSGSDPTGQN